MSRYRLFEMYQLFLSGLIKPSLCLFMYVWRQESLFCRVKLVGWVIQFLSILICLFFPLWCVSFWEKGTIGFVWLCLLCILGTRVSFSQVCAMVPAPRPPSFFSPSRTPVHQFWNAPASTFPRFPFIPAFSFSCRPCCIVGGPWAPSALTAHPSAGPTSPLQVWTLFRQFL